MDTLFVGTRLIDTVIALTLLEWLVVYLYFRTTGKGLAPHQYTLNLVSGLCLMLALRSVLAVGPGWAMVVFLSLAGLAHGADMLRRWKLPTPSS